MKADVLGIKIIPKMQKVEIRLLVTRSAAEALPQTGGKNLSVEITEKRRKRSLSANAYFWVIAGKIAAAIGTSADEVYRKAVHDVGDYEIFSMRPEAVDTFRGLWESRGVGWITEVLTTEYQGLTEVKAYLGSSVYDGKRMARLIDWVVDEAKTLKIQTLTPAQQAQLVEEWGRQDGNRKASTA